MRSQSPVSVREPSSRAAWFGALARDREQAEAELGAGHPLLDCLARLQTSLAQAAIVGACAVAGGTVRLAGGDWVPPALLIGAAAAEVVLLIRWLSARAAVQDTCLDLLVEGRGGAHIGALEQERRRLGRPEHRARLARWILDLVDAAESPRRSPYPPVFVPHVVRSVEPELRAIAESLVRATPAARGVALVQQLLERGVSSLYGADADRLRRDLGRVRYLLDDAAADDGQTPAVTSSSSRVRTGP